MTTINITISFDAMNSQGGELVVQEIAETIDGLTNSLRTQVNNVQVDVKTKIK